MAMPEPIQIALGALRSLLSSFDNLYPSSLSLEEEKRVDSKIMK
jgi:hypothetical protein